MVHITFLFNAAALNAALQERDGLVLFQEVERHCLGTGCVTGPGLKEGGGISLARPKTHTRPVPSVVSDDQVEALKG